MFSREKVVHGVGLRGLDIAHSPGTPLGAGLVLKCVLLVLSLTLVSAEDAAIPRDRIETLIRSLDASTLAERTRAERKILDLGPDALPLLPAPELIESTSARESVRRIRLQLERRAAKESSAPSHVSLQGEWPLAEILRQIQNQTGNGISLADGGLDIKDERIIANWNRTTFWDCLDDLCERGEFQWQFAKDAAAIRISKAPAPAAKSRAVQRTGPFRLAIDRIERRSVVGDDRQRLLRVSGRLSIEPRLRPLFLSTAAANLKATADENRLLASWNPDAKYEHPVRDGNREVPIQWDFGLSAGAEVMTLAIRGRIHCQIAAAIERVVFDQTSQTRGTIRRRGGVSVRLRDVTFNTADSEGLNAEIGVTVSYDNGGPAFESHRTWIFHNVVYLETKTGARTNFTEFDTMQQADGAVAVDYRWLNIAPPANQYLLVYEAPTLIVDVPLDIDLGEFPIAE